MKPNFNNIINEFLYKCHQFGKIRKYLNTETSLLVYKQTVLPLTEYVCFVMSLKSKHEFEKLQRLQNRALRMCYSIPNPRDIWHRLMKGEPVRLGDQSLQKCFMAVLFKIHSANVFLVFIFTANWVL